MTLLFAPHPDDETLGCGGFLAKRMDEGHEAFVVVLTMGEKLFSACLDIHEDPSPREVCEMRRNETRKAVEILGLKPGNLLFLDYEDMTLGSQKDSVVQKIVPILRDKKPSEVLCTSEYEGHPDHIAADEIVRRACAQAEPGITIRNYITSLRTGLSAENLPRPIQTVDVEKYLPIKEKAIQQFRSHLGIISPKQSGPLGNFDKYLCGEECFIMDSVHT